MSSYLKPIWGNLQNRGNLKFLPTSTILTCKELENQSCQLMPFTTQRIPELHSLHWNQQWHVFHHLLHHRKHPTNGDQHPKQSPLAHTVNVWFDRATGICNEIAARLWVYLAFPARGVSVLPSSRIFISSEGGRYGRFLYMPTHKVYRSLGNKTDDCLVFMYIYYISKSWTHTFSAILQR